MKAKGLQRLRWYCQICQKQCRDENGFKCHTQSESHLRQMLVVGESAGKHISDFSSQLQHDFVQLLSRRFGTKRVKANNVYQEFIQDKNHLHMNATRWVTLTEFVKHLGRTGIARVDETEKGWFIAWIDNSPKALAKQVSSPFPNFFSSFRICRVLREQSVEVSQPLQMATGITSLWDVTRSYASAISGCRVNFAARGGECMLVMLSGSVSKLAYPGIKALAGTIGWPKRQRRRRVCLSLPRAAECRLLFAGGGKPEGVSGTNCYSAPGGESSRLISPSIGDSYLLL